MKTTIFAFACIVSCCASGFDGFVFGEHVAIPGQVQFFSGSGKRDVEDKNQANVVLFYQAINNYPLPKRESWLVGVVTGAEGPYLKSRIGIVGDGRVYLEWPRTQKSRLAKDYGTKKSLEGFYDEGYCLQIDKENALVCLGKGPQRGQRGVMEAFLLSTNYTHMVYSYEALSDRFAQFATFDVDNDNRFELICREQLKKENGDTLLKLSAFKLDQKTKYLIQTIQSSERLLQLWNTNIKRETLGPIVAVYGYLVFEK